MAKKTVVKVSITGEKEKRDVLKAVAKLEGINELSMDVAKGTLTVIGDADPVCIITCLRKKCGRCAEIQTVGPPKPEKPKPKCPSPCRLPPCRPYPYSSCCEYEANACSIL
ncbi:heavy metal-associated isoprenylated plant protein 2 [Rhodamnia argentea]|uniref:Heavy metal-associated isoprenylated plant protein 2 n=1 Tax=Rhodamnia argentea TaxID=178133 RepID=A0A8B8P3W8_9MYRT|nr:heavy metal-associated isoprenylated plant protein 2 [Rhodamnia argentea]